MNHLDGCGYRHGSRFPFHAGDGGEPLPQRSRARVPWIELTRDPADACGPQRISASNVTRATRPNEIRGRGVPLAAVDVTYFDVPHRSTECAELPAQRWAGSCAIAKRPVGDLVGGLAPTSVAPPGAAYSGSSSSSDSSGSSGATISAMLSSWSCRDSFSSSKSRICSLRSLICSR